MATLVGNEENFADMIRNLILLEHDAIAAYDDVIEGLSDAAAAHRIKEFRQDHHSHLDVLRAMAAQLGIDPPEQGDMKQVLTRGKIMLAEIIGDSAILKAMKTNEDDTVTAYQRAARHPDAIDASRLFFEKALEDERRHRDWMISLAEAVRS
ncbi:MAG: ferritin-like domain-containing protein [Paracoccaceae bacterium]|nr:ferritin-like domain-containing protein [Paracoccaceae bacterium]